jgi:hypothetical protein
MGHEGRFRRQGLESMIPTCIYHSAAAGGWSGRAISANMWSCFVEAEDPRMEIVAWLRDLGLERYVPAFRDNEID